MICHKRKVMSNIKINHSKDSQTDLEHNKIPSLTKKSMIAINKIKGPKADHLTESPGLTKARGISSLSKSRAQNHRIRLRMDISMRLIIVSREISHRWPIINITTMITLRRWFLKGTNRPSSRSRI